MHVDVWWTDGRVYPATVTGFSQGYVQVQWDVGGAAVWVLQTSVSPRVAAPPPSVAAPQPVPQVVQPAQPAPPSAAEILKMHFERAMPGQVEKPAPPPPGPPPRPMEAQIRGLPRGLVYEPTGRGPGDGQAFFVLFGFLATADADTAMRMTDIEHLGDDVAALRAAGYRVLVDLHGDLATLNAALAGTHPEAKGAPTTGVFWGGHGDEDGTISTHDGGWIAPEQIAPAATARGSVKLFVMSACHSGNHAHRWQKALGPQAKVIGWGAPITNARAVEFLVPDDANAKGFDDLLEKHLGVRSVTSDGPLTEVKELATQHEDRVATLLLPLETLVSEAKVRLKCPVEKSKSGAYFFEVRTLPSKDAPDRPRSQLVRVGGMGVSDAWVHLSSIVGPYSDALDLARALRIVAPATHLRVSLLDYSQTEPPFVIVETLLRRRRLDPFALANNILTVGVHADRIEDLFFGSDRQ
jgi:hypothetical protein